MALSLPQQLEQLDAARMRAYRDNLAFYGGATGRARPGAGNGGLPSTTCAPSRTR